MRIIRIALFGIAGLMGLTELLANAQMMPRHNTIVAFETMPITVRAGDYDIVNQVIDVPPGATIPNHYNGGPAVVSLLSGKLAITGANGMRVLLAGQSTTVQSGYRHFAANTGTSTARLSVSYLIPRGAALNTFVK